MMTHSDLDLKLEAYHYDLPAELIADRPVSGRDGSRLLVYHEASGEVVHARFHQLANFLPPKSTLVRNATKVFPCRIIAHKESGGAVEVFFLAKNAQDQLYPVLLKSSGKKKLGLKLSLPGQLSATIAAIHGDGTFALKIQGDVASMLETHGKIPIPPYIRGGESDEQDRRDYQTVYAKEVGSVAAPTAGLHFTAAVFKSLEEKQIDSAEVTLHVGMGTFAPVKSSNIQEHKMHRERFFVSEPDRQRINQASSRIAVGTTSLRALESGWRGDHFALESQQWHETDIFLHPGKDVHSIDGLITNFHLPGSSLIMLVSALIGREKTLELYRLAVKERYRFFSYGDAMLILRKNV